MGLMRLEKRGLVRRVLLAPEIWWELVGPSITSKVARGDLRG
jgi:hypothetical protein